MLRDSFNQLDAMVGEVTRDGQLPGDEGTDSFLRRSHEDLAAMLNTIQELERELSLRVYDHAYDQDSLQLRSFAIPELPEFLS